MELTEFAKYVTINGNSLKLNTSQINYIHFIEWCAKYNHPANYCSLQKWIKEIYK